MLVRSRIFLPRFTFLFPNFYCRSVDNEVVNLTLHDFENTSSWLTSFGWDILAQIFGDFAYLKQEA